MSSLPLTGITESIATIARSLSLVTGEHYNAELTFSAASGLVAIVDPDTGNYTLGDTSEVVLLAKLTQSKDPYGENNPGIDTNRVYFSGYLTNPSEYSGLLPKQAQAKILDRGCGRVGTFYFIDAIANPLSEECELNAAIGQKICGYFEVDEGC